jgi:hypothetical protein
MKFKFGLSRRKKVPVFYILGYSVLPHKGLELIVRSRWLRTVSETDESIIFEAFGQRLKLLREYAFWFIDEWNVWKNCYLPRFSLKGKTVLDIGAGCGETAFFYFLHGAKKVVAIEPYVKAVSILRENAEINKWNVHIIPEKFKLEHLEIPHDFMKVDIEGGEVELLKVEINEPCIVEVHNNELKTEFKRRGFKKLYSLSNFVHIMGKEGLKF